MIALKQFAVLNKFAKEEEKSAEDKYGDGTTYKDSEGKTHKRVSYPGTERGDAYCGRTISQKRTAKVKQRRKDWGCEGKKSVASLGYVLGIYKEAEEKKKKDTPCWEGYERVPGTALYSEGSCEKKKGKKKSKVEKKAQANSVLALKSFKGGFK